MTRLFGTDGIRGVANVDLRPTLAYALGRATVRRLVPPGGAIVVGQDTRRSGDMLAAALVAGATSMGADVYRAGVLPTPALAFLAGSGRFAAGIMVSASHNPARDNGLKVLDERGLKLDDAVEDELEALIWRSEELTGPENQGLGREVEAGALLDEYRAHRLALARGIGSRLRVVLDCANGSASAVAPAILAASGASVETLFDAPDGININAGCGATDPAALAGARARQRRGRGVRPGRRRRPLRGRRRAGPGRGWRSAHRPAGARPPGAGSAGRQDARRERPLQWRARRRGDRRGRPRGADAGGRQVHPGGDARLGGRTWRREERPRHHRRAHLPRATASSPRWRRWPSWPGGAAASRSWPTRWVSTPGAADGPVRHKDQWEADAHLADAVRAAETELAGRGRVLVRPSGTEAALRVMIEGRDAVRIAELADALAALAVERLN